jgi:hypothetical protein
VVIEIDVEKTKVTRISMQPSPIQTTIDPKQLENVEYFSYLGSMTTNDARCTREIKSRVAMTKAAGKNHQQTGFKFEEETSEVAH